MSLPTISTLNTVQDTNKQLAAIRSYLIQLKDELEAELSNVTYDMLSVPLQKKIDAISEDIAANKIQQDITAQYISAQFAQVNELVADTLVAAEVYARDMKAEAISVSEAYANSVVANKVTAGEVRGIIGEYSFVTTDVLSADVASLNTAIAGKADIGALNALSATVGSLTTTVSSFDQGNISTGNINARQFTIYEGNGSYKPIQFVRSTLGGVTAWFAYHT